MQAVAEAWRNLTAVGARPLAITDNMNFGNPEKPEIMGQFAAAIRGMAAACRALDFPVVSGNVSLYNETEGRSDPADARDRRPRRARGRGQGGRHRARRPGSISCSSARRRAGSASRSGCGRSAGASAARRRRSICEAERKAGRFRARANRAGTVRACHDVSDGGLLVALAEMAMAGDTGMRLSCRSARHSGARLLVRRGSGTLHPRRCRIPRASSGSGGGGRCRRPAWL